MRSANFDGMVRFAYRFLLVLIVFAVIGGPTVYLAQPPQFRPSMAMVDVPCDMAMPVADAGHDAPMVPCKGMTRDCIKQMGCVADVALPTRLAGTNVVFVFTPIAYWSNGSVIAGVVREPEDLPPRII